MQSKSETDVVCQWSSGDTIPNCWGEFREIRKSKERRGKDGALAGLGRVGDASCVPVILAAIRDAAPPTLLVGMDALRALPGEDANRALIDACPKLPSRAQLALIPVLGARHDPLGLPILEQLARSDQAETRLAALEALGDSDLPQAMNLLSAEAERGDEARRAKVHEIIARHRLREIENRPAILPQARTTPISRDYWESSAAGGSSDRSNSATRTRDGRRATSVSPT